MFIFVLKTELCKRRLSLHCVNGDFEAECVNDACYFSEVTLESENDTISEFCVKGRLKEHVGFWREELEAPEAVLSVIESGYVLQSKSMPASFCAKESVVS